MPNEKVALRTLHVPQCNHADVVARVQRELVMALENYVAVNKSKRIAAQVTLEQMAPTIAEKVSAQHAAEKTDIRSRLPGKQNAKKRDAMYRVALEVKKHEIADPIVQGFEKAYKATRASKQSIFDRIKDSSSYIGMSDSIRCFYYRGSKDDWIVGIFNGERWIPIIELWFGSERFLKTQDPRVFVHRTKDDGEYVQDRHGFFVARYLIRNMSAFDREKIGSIPKPEPILTAKADKIPTDGEIMKEINTHVRAKEASGGDTCFLSFTHTKHAIFGSTGAQFYKQEKGDVIIDASKIDQNALIDLHSLDAVEQIFGVKDVDPEMAFKEGDPTFEANAAARDTVRTREILVAGHVNQSGVVAVRFSTINKKAPWQDINENTKVLPTGIPDAWRT